MKYSDYLKRTAWEVHELATKREEIYQRPDPEENVHQDFGGRISFFDYI